MSQTQVTYKISLPGTRLPATNMRGVHFPATPDLEMTIERNWQPGARDERIVILHDLIGSVTDPAPMGLAHGLADLKYDAHRLHAYGIGLTRHLDRVTLGDQIDDVQALLRHMRNEITSSIVLVGCGWGAVVAGLATARMTQNSSAKSLCPDKLILVGPDPILSGPTANWVLNTSINNYRPGTVSLHHPLRPTLNEGYIDQVVDLERGTDPRDPATSPLARAAQSITVPTLIILSERTPRAGLRKAWYSYINDNHSTSRALPGTDPTFDGPGHQKALVDTVVPWLQGRDFPQP